MRNQWLMFEHERLHQVESWPESARKNATLAAIASTIAMLEAHASDARPPECLICRARRNNASAVPAMAA